MHIFVLAWNISRVNGSTTTESFMGGCVAILGHFELKALLDCVNIIH